MKHKFIEYIPEKIEEGTLYISTEFNVTKHKCPCGCGKEIVTSLSPVGWTLIYNGKTVSLKPSIGNWQHACKSHYFITNNEVVWLSGISDGAIKKVIAKDLQDRDEYYSNDKTIHKVFNFFTKILKRKRD